MRCAAAIITPPTTMSSPWAAPYIGGASISNDNVEFLTVKYLKVSQDTIVLSKATLPNAGYQQPYSQAVRTVATQINACDPGIPKSADYKAFFLP